MGRTIFGQRQSARNRESDDAAGSSKTIGLLADNLSGRGPGVGCGGHLLILSMPVLAMVSTVAFLAVLLVYDRTEIRGNDFYGDEDLRDVAGVYYGTIREDTISYVMSRYEPYPVVVALASIAAVLDSFVTVARNIQIEVYHRRNESSIVLRVVNYLGSFVNILCYAGLLVAVSFKVDQEEPSWAVFAHFYGALFFFAGASIYVVLHAFLLWKQGRRHYPAFVQGFFAVLAVGIAICSILFVLPIWNDGLSSDDGTQPVLEWVAVFGTALSIGAYSVLFHIDPVDDELWDFFCGRRASRRRQKQKQQQQQQQQSERR